MKRRALLLVLLMLLSLATLHDNPVISTFISEFVVLQGGDWRLELLFPTGRTLDGWGLASRWDTAYFKPGIAVGSGFTLFSKDSLQESLLFSRIAEKVLVLAPFGEAGTLTYGSLPNSDIESPRFGQSICYKSGEGFFYYDNSPTLGAQNDTSGAMGDLECLVTDTTGLPLKGVNVVPSDMTGREWSSDSLGEVRIHDYARRHALWFSLPGYNSQRAFVQLFPDSQVKLTVTMTVVVGVYQSAVDLPAKVRLLQNYPNPFNPATTITYELPRPMNVRMTICDLQGRSVGVLVSGRKDAGLHRVTFDGSGLPSGIYFCRLSAETFVGVEKLVLLR